MALDFAFDLPKASKSIIKVLGVGGGGSNAVTHMFNQGIKDVEFVICNTDLQALKSSPVTTKIQLGTHLTEGLGAGANPEKGKESALESKEQIRDLLGHDTKMVFITAGMGGGTGTGAAPIIAEVAKDLGILTVGIVTAPFQFEGKKKSENASRGIQEMKNHCDTVLVILNDRLREIYGNLSIRSAFAQADGVLTNAAKSIAEIITVTSEVNVDFEDVRTVMENSGAAVMGSAMTSGENRAHRAAEEALSSPLLNNTTIQGAEKILLSIRFGDEAELSMDELTEITDYIQDEAGAEADLIFGQGLDPTLGDQICVTVIATGFEDPETNRDKSQETDRKVIGLEEKYNQQETPVETPRPNPQAQPNFDLDEDEEVNAEDWSVTRKEEEPVNQISMPEITSKWEKEPQEEEFDGVNSPTSMDRLKADAEARRSKFKDKHLDGQNGLEPEEFRERITRPAFERKQLRFFKVPESSKSQMSRFHLNEDNELLGDNRFLHDNVD